MALQPGLSNEKSRVWGVPSSLGAVTVRNEFLKLDVTFLLCVLGSRSSIIARSTVSSASFFNPMSKPSLVGEEAERSPRTNRCAFVSRIDK